MKLKAKRLLLKLLQLLISFLILSSLNCKIIQKNGKFMDESGRARIFHGVNVVFKLPPYIPSNGPFDPFLSFNFQEDINYLKKFGFNLVRLGVMWEAIEKSENEYDLELLDKYFNLVQELGRNGIYTIIDAHQDVLSRQTCGEGIPAFYARSANPEQTCNSSVFKKFLHLLGVCKPMADYGYSTDEQGLPRIEDCRKRLFGLYNTAPEVTSLYKKLYENENGLQDKFINFWKVVASKFRSSEFVLGYDIWNEPYPGGLYDDPLNLLFPSKADDTQLLPFYRRIDSSLREVDPEYTLMFEPMPFPDYIPLLGSLAVRGRFSEAPLKAANLSEKQMFNYHSYCCSAGLSICASGEPQLSEAEFCRKIHQENVQLANEYAQTFGFGAIITEFGACFNTDACYTEISSLTDAADSALNSWAYWMYKPFNDFTTSCIDDKEGLFEKDGSLQDKKVRALTRSYASAFQGKPVFMKFFGEEKVLVFKFVLDRKLNAPTRVYYFKEMHYASGVRLFSSHEDVKVDGEEENYFGLKFEAVAAVGENENDFRFDGKDNGSRNEEEKLVRKKFLNKEDVKEFVTIILVPKTYEIIEGKNQHITKFFEDANMKEVYEN